MATNPGSLAAAEDIARTIAGHLAFLAEGQLARVHDARIGDHLHSGVARDFTTPDGQRVMVTDSLSGLPPW